MIQLPDNPRFLPDCDTPPPNTIDATDFNVILASSLKAKMQNLETIHCKLCDNVFYIPITTNCCQTTCCILCLRKMVKDDNKCLNCDGCIDLDLCVDNTGVQEVLDKIKPKCVVKSQKKFGADFPQLQTAALKSEIRKEEYLKHDDMISFFIKISSNSVNPDSNEMDDSFPSSRASSVSNGHSSEKPEGFKRGYRCGSTRTIAFFKVMMIQKFNINLENVVINFYCQGHKLADHMTLRTVAYTYYTSLMQKMVLSMTMMPKKKSKQKEDSVEIVEDEQIIEVPAAIDTDAMPMLEAEEPQTSDERETSPPPSPAVPVKTPTVPVPMSSAPSSSSASVPLPITSTTKSPIPTHSSASSTPVRGPMMPPQHAMDPRLGPHPMMYMGMGYPPGVPLNYPQMPTNPHEMAMMMQRQRQQFMNQEAMKAMPIEQRMMVDPRYNMFLMQGQEELRRMHAQNGMMNAAAVPGMNRMRQNLAGPQSTPKNSPTQNSEAAGPSKTSPPSDKKQQPRPPHRADYFSQNMKTGEKSPAQNAIKDQNGAPNANGAVPKSAESSGSENAAQKKASSQPPELTPANMPLLLPTQPVGPTMSPGMPQLFAQSTPSPQPPLKKDEQSPSSPTKQHQQQPIVGRVVPIPVSSVSRYFSSTNDMKLPAVSNLPKYRNGYRNPKWPNCTYDVEAIMSSDLSRRAPLNQEETTRALELYYLNARSSHIDPSTFLNDYYNYDKPPKLDVNLTDGMIEKFITRQFYNMRGVVIPQMEPQYQLKIFQEMYRKQAVSLPDGNTRRRKRPSVPKEAKKANERENDVETTTETNGVEAKKIRKSEVSAYVVSTPLNSDSSMTTTMKIGSNGETEKSSRSGSASNSSSPLERNDSIELIDVSTPPLAASGDEQSNHSDDKKNNSEESTSMIDALTLSRQSAKTLGKTLAESMRRSGPSPVKPTLKVPSISSSTC